MLYLGGKARLAKRILPTILAGRTDGQTYVEPFLGGCNVLPHVTGTRIGSDAEGSVIRLYSALRDGWEPPTSVTEDEYRAIRTDPAAFHPAMEAFAAFGCSFGGKRWGGYARNKDGYNYASCTRNGLLKIRERLRGVTLVHGGYDSIDIPPRSLIYCDPPYAGTTGYGGSFDHGKFWSWASAMVDAGHAVFVSEYSAPSDWTCVWEGSDYKSVRKQSGPVHAVERLFTTHGLAPEERGK